MTDTIADGVMEADELPRWRILSVDHDYHIDFYGLTVYSLLPGAYVDLTHAGPDGTYYEYDPAFWGGIQEFEDDYGTQTYVIGALSHCLTEPSSENSMGLTLFRGTVEIGIWLQREAVAGHYCYVFGFAEGTPDQLGFDPGWVPVPPSPGPEPPVFLLPPCPYGVSHCGPAEERPIGQGQWEAMLRGWTPGELPVDDSGVLLSDVAVYLTVPMMGYPLFVPDLEFIPRGSVVMPREGVPYSFNLTCKRITHYEYNEVPGTLEATFTAQCTVGPEREADGSLPIAVSMCASGLRTTCEVDPDTGEAWMSDPESTMDWIDYEAFRKAFDTEKLIFDANARCYASTDYEIVAVVLRSPLRSGEVGGGNADSTPGQVVQIEI